MAAGLSSGGLLSIDALAQGKAKINMQLGWIVGVNQIGEVAAKRLGFYEQEASTSPSSPAGPTSTAWPSSRPGATRWGRCPPARR